MLAKKPPLKRSGRLEFHTYSIKDNMVMHALVGRCGPRLGKVMMGNIAELDPTIALDSQKNVIHLHCREILFLLETIKYQTVI